MNYNIEYKESSIIISNTGSLEINYILYLLICSNDTKLVEGKLKPNSKIELKYLTNDGDFKLNLKAFEEDTNEYFTSYYNTIKMIVDNIEKICSESDDCGCKTNNSCKDLTDDCNVLLQPLVMSLSYYFLNPIKYIKTLNYLSQVLNCNISKLLSCIININYIIGKPEYKKLSQQLSIVFYSMFYVNAILSSESEEEVLNIDKLYKIDKLRKCIKDFGIDIDLIFDNIIDKDIMKVYFWQQDLNSQETIEDIDFSLTQEILYTHSYKNIDLFLQGILIPFNNLGKIVFVVNNTLDLDYQIEDFLGNDITNMFDKIYNVGLNSTIFLSKIPYSTSDIYFKFKQKLLSNG